MHGAASTTGQDFAQAAEVKREMEEVLSHKAGYSRVEGVGLRI